MTRIDESTEMPFLDHLEELRWRLIRAIGALLVCVLVAFWAVGHFHIISILSRPAGQRLMFTHPADAITAYMTISLGVGLVVASPVILYQAWGFVSPALKAGERRVARYVFAGGTLLFLMGVTLAYFFVLPATLRMGAQLAPEFEQRLTVHE
ncbi:MAG TPA: twin-arginine translocase subunit TatC, partial [Gemmatimonadaceae bacterium]|nr:twin-arginine translocase subunit TatC [Gemmatimonadaceae bacterium]